MVAFAFRAWDVVQRLCLGGHLRSRGHLTKQRYLLVALHFLEPLLPLHIVDPVPTVVAGVVYRVYVGFFFVLVLFSNRAGSKSLGFPGMARLSARSLDFQLGIRAQHLVDYVGLAPLDDTTVGFYPFWPKDYYDWD